MEVMQQLYTFQSRQRRQDKILVFTQDKKFSLSLELLLFINGYKVVTASDEYQVMDALACDVEHDEQVSLAVIDVESSRKMTTLKDSCPKILKINFLLISDGMGGDEAVFAMKNLGVKSRMQTLCKPFRPEDFSETISGMMPGLKKS